MHSVSGLAVDFGYVLALDFSFDHITWKLTAAMCITLKTKKTKLIRIKEDNKTHSMTGMVCKIHNQQCLFVCLFVLLD